MSKPVAHPMLYQRLVRRAFHHFYREFAWSYDLVAWLVSRGLWHRWALAGLPLLQGRVLELGFGTGYVQAALGARPAVVGVDASPQMAALAAGRVRRNGHPARLARGLAQALPFPNAAFDTLLATFPAEYILDPATHAEIRRVLAPHGRLVIVDGAQFGANGVYERLVAIAYRLTLQASPRRQPERMAHLQIAGLALTPHWVAVGASRVMVLVGDQS